MGGGSAMNKPRVACAGLLPGGLPRLARLIFTVAQSELGNANKTRLSKQQISCRFELRHCLNFQTNELLRIEETVLSRKNLINSHSALFVTNILHFLLEEKNSSHKVLDAF